MSKYERAKERARQEAIEWQQWAAEQSLSWWDVAGATDHFYNLGKRYGLLKEFRENGII